MTKEYFLDKAKSIHGDKYNYIDLPDNFKQKEYIQVEYQNVIYKQRALKHLDDKSPEKKITRNTTEDFITKAKEVWGNKYDYSLTNYQTARRTVKIIYDGIIYRQLPNSHLAKCPVEGYLDPEVFLQKAEKKWGNKYDYSLMKFINANSKIKILFDGIVYEQTPANHLNYAPERLLKKTQEEFISDAIEVHGNRFSYDKVNYITDRDKIIITCKVDGHNDFKQTPNSHLRGAGCPKCIESKGERAIIKFLKVHNIDFEVQKTYDDCKHISHLRFDMYVTNYNILIEFNGHQHYQPIDYFGGQDAFEKQLLKDSIKKEYCEKNNIQLIVIPYFEYKNINKILKETLKIA